MRLLWLIDSLTLGGAESLAVTFASAAPRHGLQLTVCALKTIDGNPIEARLREIGVEVVNLEAKNLRDLRAFRRLLALIRERGVQVIHSHLTYASIWGSIASRRTRIPHIVTLHTLPVGKRGTRRDRVRQRILSLLMARCAFRVVAVSQAQAGAWEGRRLVPGEKVTVVPNAVEHAPGGMPARNGSPQTIGTVAVLREGKGIDVLLRAFRRVLDHEPQARLVIAGDGPLRDALVAQGEQLRLGASVQWLGYRKDVAQLLPSFDLFVHPTLVDALPTAVLEAMAAGIPVIASAAGGVPEIVTHEVNGLLVEPGDDEALADAVLRMFHEEALRLRFAAKGRETVAQRFSPDRWVRTLRDLYERAIGSGA